jgi:hypothetical protein
MDSSRERQEAKLADPLIDADDQEAQKNLRRYLSGRAAMIFLMSK